MSNSPIINRVSKEQQEIVGKVFRRTLAMYQPGKELTALKAGTHLNAWDWGPGIALYGLQKTYHLLDPQTQQEYLEFWRNWFETNLDKTEPSITLNGALLLNVLWTATHDSELPLEPWEREGYRAYCRKRADFYLKNAVRQASGVFGHTVAGFPDSSSQVWADNLFMLVLFLAKGAVTLGKPKQFGEMVRQLELHYQHLTDHTTNLLYHGWQFDQNGPEQDSGGYSGSHINGALWGRGNGWAAMAVAELLELCDDPDFSNFRPRIVEVITPHFQALLNCQRADGRWNTLLNQSASYPETSATAAIGYAFNKCARLGVLGTEYAVAGKLSLEAVRQQIFSEGEVLGVSGSTPLLAELEAYNKIPNDVISTWGQGIGLLALSEYR
jgi:unsaturated rhamnogalacturonyl hydrolase